MYQEYPQNIEVQTSVGKVTLAVTNGQHVYVNGPEIEISGKPIRLSIHLFHRNGEWTDKNCDGRTTLYAKKSNVMTLSDEATPTQKQKARDAIVPTVVAFMRDNPHLLKQAQEAHVGNAVEKLEAESWLCTSFTVKYAL